MNLALFQKCDFGRSANFDERCGKMSYRLRLAGWLNDAGIRHYHRAQALVIRVFGDELINMLFAIWPGLHYLPLSSCLIAIA